MTTPTPTSQPDARAEALVAAFERAAYRRVAPAILQPAEPFLDLSGEDIRKRMYLTADPEGRELCLGLDATAHYGIAAPEIRIGDVGLFGALVAALDLAPAWKRRLVKDFNRKSSLAHELDVLTFSAVNK